MAHTYCITFKVVPVRSKLPRVQVVLRLLQFLLRLIQFGLHPLKYYINGRVEQRGAELLTSGILGLFQIMNLRLQRERIRNEFER